MRTAYRLATCLGFLLIPGIASTQTVPGDVTFEVPINLTRLDPRITQIDVTCNIATDALANVRTIRGTPVANQLAGHIVLPVTRGRVVTTANVVVAIAQDTLQDPAGKTATYECGLTGYSSGIYAPRGNSEPAGWDRFAENHTNPAFRLSPTPAPLTGSFTW